MEGLNDGRAMKTIIPQINPRKMILVHGTAAATDSLIESLSNVRTMTKDIYAPANGDALQIGQQTNSFSVNISDELRKALRPSRVCGLLAHQLLILTVCSLRIMKFRMSEREWSLTIPLPSLPWNPSQYRQLEHCQDQ